MKSKPYQSPSSSSFPFQFAVTRTAVAQICRSVGFKSSQNSALSALTDIAIHYLQSLAAAAVSSANSTGRTQSNLLDVVFAIEHLHSLKGFSGGSNLSRKYYESGPLFGLFDFMCSSEEIPFAKPVKFRRENEKLGRPHVTLSRKDEIVRSRTTIPKWLPDVPVIGGGNEGERMELGSEGNGGVVVVEEMKGGMLPMKRGKVRFKMGF